MLKNFALFHPYHLKHKVNEKVCPTCASQKKDYIKVCQKSGRNNLSLLILKISTSSTYTISIQRFSRFLNIGFAHSKWPHLHRAYVVSGPSQSHTIVFSFLSIKIKGKHATIISLPNMIIMLMILPQLGINVNYECPLFQKLRVYWARFKVYIIPTLNIPKCS